MRLRFPMKSAVLAFVVFLVFIPQFSVGIRMIPGRIAAVSVTVGNGFDLGSFVEAPDYRNGKECVSQSLNRENFVSSCDASLVHVAMTLDSEYLRGSIAAVHSMLRHASCPENVFFHFLAAEFDPASPRVLSQLVRSTFPSLNFKVYIFREDTVINLISSSIRQALENPLNYVRNYLGDILDQCVDRVIYLDSDIIVVDDITKLWNTTLTGSQIIGAPEYCHANFVLHFRFLVRPGFTRILLGSKALLFQHGCDGDGSS